jgi:hypothetical protein
MVLRQSKVRIQPLLQKSTNVFVITPGGFVMIGSKISLLISKWTIHQCNTEEELKKPVSECIRKVDKITGTITVIIAEDKQ